MTLIGFYERCIKYKCVICKTYLVHINYFNEELYTHTNTCSIEKRNTLSILK